MIDKPVLLLTLAMFLAIGTERLLELLRALFDHLEARGISLDDWNARAEALRRRIQTRLDNARSAGRSTLEMALSLVCRYLSPAPAERGGVIAVSAERVRTMTIRVRYTLLAIAVGVGLAFLFELDLFRLVNAEMYGAAAGKHPFELPWWLGTIVSGAAMGLGAGPVHSLITALEHARRRRV